MKIKIFSLDGKEKKDIELSDDVFGIKVSMGSIYEAIKNELANRRVGTAKVKTRSEVQGSHQKYYRQKGTGRARAGTKRSPTRVGGGIAFGPQPRSYNYHVPRKIKRLAMKSILSLKTSENRIRVIEDFEIESGKTKELMSMLLNHVDARNTVIILKDDSVLTKRAGRNIPWLKLLTFNKLNAHDLYYGQNVIIHESAISELNNLYSS
ncbi:MAG: 50S ribosomal protein L4 [Spirochaetales bacterium]|nr:50S ribosomal protein L4 [Spirochaetales bacterium]